MNADPYVYPGTRVLKNKFGLQDSAKLDREEQEYVTQRIRQGVPYGDFDLAHLKAIHHHLFQDVYDWAVKSAPLKFPRGESSFSFGNRPILKLQPIDNK